MDFRNIIFISLFLLQFHNCIAWWDAGHMAVAQIAYEELEPDVKAKVDRYLEAVSAPFPHHNTFITASTWADDIIAEGIDSFFAWHGSAHPYDPEGILSQREHEDLVAGFNNNDILWAIKECLTTLKSEGGTPWAKGFMLRMLIHIAGDIHQPCHCITYYSEQFPKGDVAGTRFLLKHPVYSSMHKLFDGAFGLTERKISRPATFEDLQAVDSLATFLKDCYPRAALPELQETSVDAWRQESYDLGVSFAYAKIFPNSFPSNEVMLEGQEVTGRRLAVAAYRLADLLNDALGQKRIYPSKLEIWPVGGAKAPGLNDRKSINID